MRSFHGFIVILLAFIAGLAGVYFGLHTNAINTDAVQPPSPSAKESVYERVIHTGTLRCGFTPYSVGLSVDANSGQITGIYHDVIEQLAKNLNLHVLWVEEVGWGNQITALETGRFDLICSPVSLNAGRARAADFSIPLYYSPVHIWAQKSNTALTGDLKSLDRDTIKISTLDGEQTSVFAKQYFPHATEVSLPQSTPFSDLMMQVTTGKADIVFAEPLAVQEFMKNNPNSLRQLTPTDQPLLVVPNIILLPRDNYAFKEMIDNGLREMFNSRIIDGIIDRYEPVPGSYIRETTRR